MYFKLHCADERVAQYDCGVYKGLMLSFVSDKLTRSYLNYIAGYAKRVCSKTKSHIEGDILWCLSFRERADMLNDDVRW
jgi:hypothetical protein